MEITHKELNITTTDIAICENKKVLLQWKSVILNDITVMEAQIEKAKTKIVHGDSTVNKEWYAAVRHKRDLYKTLNQNIENRLAILNELKELSFERAVIEILKMHYPTLWKEVVEEAKIYQEQMML